MTLYDPDFNPFSETATIEEQVIDLKEAVAVGLDLCESIAKKLEGRMPSRQLAIVRTKLQETGLWIIEEEAEDSGHCIQDGIRGI